MQSTLEKICEENTERAFQRCAELPQFFAKSKDSLFNILNGCEVSKDVDGLRLSYIDGNLSVSNNVVIHYTELDKFLSVMEFQAAGINNNNRNKMTY